MRFQTSVVSGWLRRMAMRRLGQASFPSGLFYPVCLAFAGGLFAAIDAGSETPGFALESVWIYRAEVGLAFMGAVYIAGVILWLAWHGRGFVEMGAFGVTVKASEIEKIEAAAFESSEIEEEVIGLQAEAAGSILELDRRVSALEDRCPSAGARYGDRKQGQE